MKAIADQYLRGLDSTWVFGVLGTLRRGQLSNNKEKERVLILQNIVRDDDTAISMIEKTMISAFEYVNTVYTMERTLAMQRHRIEGEELRQISTNLDSNRTRKHDALISDIRILNRYLLRTFGKDIPEGGIYTGDPWHLAESSINRSAIGDWAGRLVYQFFEVRKK